MIKDFIDTLIPCKTPEIDPFDLQIENIEDVQQELRQYLCPGDTYGFLETVKFTTSTGKAGTYYLQKHLHIGYNRAAEYMNLLRERGVVRC